MKSRIRFSAPVNSRAGRRRRSSSACVPGWTPTPATVHELVPTPKFERAFQRLVRKSPGLQSQMEEALRRMAANADSLPGRRTDRLRPVARGRASGDLRRSLGAQRTANPVSLRRTPVHLYEALPNWFWMSCRRVERTPDRTGRRRSCQYYAPTPRHAPSPVQAADEYPLSRPLHDPFTFTAP